MSQTEGLLGALLKLPIFEAEWVLWLLMGLSLVSVAIIVERALFFWRRAVDTAAVREKLNTLLERGQLAEAADYLASFDALETNVVLFGLRQQHKGPDSVEDLLQGASAHETQRYSARLNFLATLGSNAPFIGLFGTVLGIIKAFAELSKNLASVGGGLMSAIAEALVATGVGLFVAIPAVIAYNAFMRQLEGRSAQSTLLSKTLLAHLKADNTPQEA